MQAGTQGSGGLVLSVQETGCALGEWGEECIPGALPASHSSTPHNTPGAAFASSELDRLDQEMAGDLEDGEASSAPALCPTVEQGQEGPSSVGGRVLLPCLHFRGAVGPSYRAAAGAAEKSQHLCVGGPS